MLERKEIVVLDKLCMIMSSCVLMARLQTYLKSLDANKQDNIGNTLVVDGASCFGRCESKQDWH